MSSFIEQTALARQIVRKLTMKTGFDPEMFPHPQLRAFWNRLEAKALERTPSSGDSLFIIRNSSTIVNVNPLLLFSLSPSVAVGQK